MSEKSYSATLRVVLMVDVELGPRESFEAAREAAAKLKAADLVKIKKGDLGDWESKVYSVLDQSVPYMDPD